MDSILCENLTRTFKSKGRTVEALRGVDLSVKKGELFGLLGPNGAGKTTLIKIFTTLLLPTTGKAKVGGMDVVKDVKRVRPMINMVSGGEYTGYGLLTVKENLWMFSQFYGIPSKEAKGEIDRLIQRMRISHLANRKIRTLSTGERQRVNIIRAFMTRPKIIFLDEPTLGLDVETSRLIRRFIREWLSEDRERTVLLTTHYMMEADELCDRIAIINDGNIVALDTPRALKKRIQEETALSIEITPQIKLDWLNETKGVIGFSPKEDSGMISVRVVMQEDSAVTDVLTGITKRGGKIMSFKKEEPTLEDVFVKLTGRGLD